MAFSRHLERRDYDAAWEMIVREPLKSLEFAACMERHWASRACTNTALFHEFCLRVVQWERWLRFRLARLLQDVSRTLGVAVPPLLTTERERHFKYTITSFD